MAAFNPKALRNEIEEIIDEFMTEISRLEDELYEAKNEIERLDTDLYELRAMLDNEEETPCES